jgi:hypothetical protein
MHLNAKVEKGGAEESSAKKAKLEANMKNAGDLGNFLFLFFLNFFLNFFKRHKKPLVPTLSKNKTTQTSMFGCFPPVGLVGKGTAKLYIWVWRGVCADGLAWVR